MSVFWCNGEWLDSGEIPVSGTDRGLLHGLGLFETVLAVAGAPVFVERHLTRLENSAERLGWSLSGLNEWPAVMAELLHRRGLTVGRARLRLSVTAGSGPLGDLQYGPDAVQWLTADPVIDHRGKALRVMLSPWRRNEHSAVAGLKCASYAENLVALNAAKLQGFDEVIFLNGASDVCEAAMANVFIVCDGKLHTPELASGCLAGVTREVVIGLARDIGVEVVEGRIGPDQLAAADECFLTSAVRGLMPVACLGDRKYPASEVTERLHTAWNKAVSLQVK